MQECFVLKHYNLMGQVLWVRYTVPLEYCKAGDQRLCPIGCLSHLLMAPLNTPSSFQLLLSNTPLHTHRFPELKSVLGESPQGTKVIHAKSPEPRAAWWGVTAPMWGWRSPATRSPAFHPQLHCHQRGAELTLPYVKVLRRGVARPTSFHNSKLCLKGHRASFSLALHQWSHSQAWFLNAWKASSGVIHLCYCQEPAMHSQQAMQNPTRWPLRAPAPLPLDEMHPAYKNL